MGKPKYLFGNERVGNTFADFFQYSFPSRH